MKSSPIYQKKYNTDRTNQSSGETTRQSTTTYVGSSASNSHRILSTLVDKTVLQDKIRFDCFVNGKLNRTIVFKNNKGVAGTKLETIEH